MANDLEYMQMATGVYRANQANEVGPPLNWTGIDWEPDGFDGFSAGAFRNQTTNEIVIAYTGTNDLPDKFSWLAGSSLLAPQIFEAVRYYAKIAKRYEGSDAPPTITFTGHSLGGAWPRSWRLCSISGPWSSIRHRFCQPPRYRWRWLPPQSY
jgi:hypothetical protein